MDTEQPFSVGAPNFLFADDSPSTHHLTLPTSPFSGSLPGWPNDLSGTAGSNGSNEQS
jgi:hypothetical protein